jgi:hypothetical protein
MRNKMYRVLPIIFIIPSIYLVYLCIVTIISVNTTSHEFGDLYTQYLYNAVVQLSFSIGILISVINLYIRYNFRKIELQTKVFAKLTVVLSIILIVIYVYGYFYIRLNLIGAWNMLFFGISISISVPIALLFAQILILLQKPRFLSKNI